MSRSDVRLALILLAVLAVFLIVFELGVSVFGWAVLCVCVGAICLFAAIIAVACMAFASIVSLIPWAAFGPAVVDPARVLGRGFDAGLWLFAFWARLAGRAFGAHVHFARTPAVDLGLALLGVCIAGGVTLAAQARVQGRATREPR
ncbi:MAG: hypothetical protein U0325_23655 [Polyangiales bacterium]